jgi:glutathione peroxidase
MTARARHTLTALVAAIIFTLASDSAVAQRRKAIGMERAKERVVQATPTESFYDITVKDIDGKETKMADHKGKVIMIVNTASKCGYTPQYAELQAMYDKYKDQGLIILAFPSNDFEQEPLSNEDIKKECAEKFKVTFPIFEKVQVKTEETACPLYKFLVSTQTNPKHGGEIKWNFTKFVIDDEGEVCARFESAVKPMSDTITKKMERYLKIRNKRNADKPDDDKTNDSADKDDPEKETEKPEKKPEEKQG